MPRLLRFVLPLILFFSASSAFAGDKLSPFKAVLKKPINLKDIFSTHHKPGRGKNLIEMIAPLTISTKIFGIGNVSINLDRKWLPAGEAYINYGFGEVKDESDPIFLRGTIKLRLSGNKNKKRSLRKLPIAAVIYDSKAKKTKLRVLFTGTTPSTRYLAVESEITEGIADKNLHINNISGRALSGKTCAEKHILNSVNSLSDIIKRKSLFNTGDRVIEISTEADGNWYDDFRSASNTEAASIINNVETLYEAQLGMTFEIIKQITYLSKVRYNTSDAENMLTLFADKANSEKKLGAADLYHLFTGKDMFAFNEFDIPDNSIIGIANIGLQNGIYFGVVCNYPELSYGITENYIRSLNYLTTAHEIGHNFGAQHVDDKSLMGTTLDAENPYTQFSTFSRNQILNHVNTFGTCLSVEAEATPTPVGVPTSGIATAVPTQRSGTSPERTPILDNPLRLTAKLAKNGAGEVSVNLDSLDTECTITLYASQNSSKISPDTAIAVFPAAPATFTFNLNARTTLKNIKDETIKIYFRAKQSCADQRVNFSEVKSIQPGRVKIKSKEISVKKWLKLLKEAFASPI